MTSKHIGRRSFVQDALVASALPGVARAIPFSTGAQDADRAHGGTTGAAEPPFFAIAPGASRPGKTIQLGTQSTISVKVSGDDNRGGFALLEVLAAPGSGSPIHIHHVENECFYILEGELNVLVGTELFHLGPGGSAYLPKMIQHAWQTEGEEPARFLSLAEPAGHLEAWAFAFSELLRHGRPTSAELKVLFEKYDMKMVGPPLPRSGGNNPTTL